MGTLTSQQIAKFYDHYRDTEIAFTKEIIQTLFLDPRQIYVKCTGTQWPCIINSSSLISAKIIVGTKGGAYQVLRGQNATGISLRFCFNPPNSQQLAFFVPVKVGAIEPYAASPDLAVVTLNFTQRPSDDLIEILGRAIETNQNSVQLKEERIIISDDSKRKLGIPREETIVFIQNVPRNCIIRELSFSGAKVLLMGIANFLTDKEVLLRIECDEPRESLGLKGSIVSAEEINGRKDLLAISIKFNDETVPMSYKMRINTYLTSVRKSATGRSQNKEPQVNGSQGA